MKTLLEFCQEEMESFVSSVNPSLGAQPADFEALTRGARGEYERVTRRVEQDPALKYLADRTIAVILDFEHQMAPVLPPAVIAQTLCIMFSKMVIIWENANQKYDEQLKPPPTT